MRRSRSALHVYYRADLHGVVRPVAELTLCLLLGRMDDIEVTRSFDIAPQLDNPATHGAFARLGQTLLLG